MTEWPEGWHPKSAVEAQEYINAHQDGTGDPELLEECKSFVSHTVRSRPIPGGGRTVTSPFVQDD